MTASTLICVVRQESVVQAIGKWLDGRIEVEWGATGKEGLSDLGVRGSSQLPLDFEFLDSLLAAGCPAARPAPQDTLNRFRRSLRGPTSQAA